MKPDALIASSTEPNTRLVIAGDEQFQLRHKFERVLPHEVCPNWVSAGRLLYPAFGASAPFFRFGNRNQPCASQNGGAL